MRIEQPILNTQAQAPARCYECGETVDMDWLTDAREYRGTCCGMTYYAGGNA